MRVYTFFGKIRITVRAMDEKEALEDVARITRLMKGTVPVEFEIDTDEYNVQSLEKKK